MKPIVIAVRGLLCAEYQLRLAPESGGEPDSAAIEREHRSVGGSGWHAARALLHWGAQVEWRGNAIGDDSHGQLIAHELELWPQLQQQVTIAPGTPTPYLIVLHGQTHGEPQVLHRFLPNIDDADFGPEVLRLGALALAPAAIGAAARAWAQRQGREPAITELLAKSAARLAQEFGLSQNAPPSWEEIEAAAKVER